MTISFLVLADTHFVVPGTGQDMTWWNRMLISQSSEIADAIVSTVRKLSPDFVVHCGDLTNTGELASFHYAKEVMDRMSCPYYITLGNHDTFQPGARETISGVFVNTNGKFYYAHEIGGFRFIFLDCAYWIRKDGQEDEHIDWDLYAQGAYSGIGPSEKELEWLERELGSNKLVPTVIVTHPPIFAKSTYPVGSLPGGKPVKQHPSPHSDFAQYCVRYDRLVHTIASAGNVKAVLAGHWHIFDISCNDGIFHCQTGSMIEFPFEMRLAQVNDRHMFMTTIGLNDQSFREGSFLAELGNGWVAGQSEDRILEMDLI